MKILSESQYNKARDYLKTYANDIDRAMFKYYFESKPVDENEYSFYSISTAGRIIQMSFKKFRFLD